ncbi:MAG: thiolase family protein [Nanoarchaeota archaeon]
MFIKGVGAIPYGIYDKKSHLLAYDAIMNCLADADISLNKIDAIVCSTLEWFYTGEYQRHFASLLSGTLKTNIPIIRVPGACAGGGTALWTAKELMKNSEFNNVLVVGAEKLHGHTRNSEKVVEEFMMAMESRWEQAEGVNAVCSAALVANEYFQKFPEASPDDLALINFKNHLNGSLNPNAFFYNKKISMEQIKNAPIIADPLTKFDCSISVDGAAACILTKDKTNIKIIGSGHIADYLPPFERETTSTWYSGVISSKEAYKEAGIEPSDIDFAEIHDAFSIVELISYEDLGFCRKGEGFKLVRDGHFNFDGKMPVNVSGGLKAKGHPVSATGLGMVFEAVNQLRNRCGVRQINKPKTALVHNIGGTGCTTVCNIIKKIGG